MGDSPHHPEETEEVINCRLHIAGMSGPNCVGRVERALMSVAGVQNALADYERGEAIVRAAGNASVEAIGQVLNDAGYRLHAVDGDPNPTPGPPTPEPDPVPEPEPEPEPAPPDPVPEPPPPRPAPEPPPVLPPPRDLKPFDDEEPRRSWLPSFRTIFRLVVYLFFLSIVWVLLYRVVPPPATIQMVGETIDGRTMHYQWVPLERISPNLVRAVIASEDGEFCNHNGFDFAEIQRSWNKAQRNGNGARGASTISQQTAKNAFLWVGRSYFRKGIEAYFTALMELTWPKRRIMEVYLNVIEFGPGIFGAEAASRHWFRKTAAQLSPMEAARLAAILPSPKRYRANPPGPYIADRGYTIAARAAAIRTYGEDRCVR